MPLTSFEGGRTAGRGPPTGLEAWRTGGCIYILYSVQYTIEVPLTGFEGGGQQAGCHRQALKLGEQEAVYIYCTVFYRGASDRL